MATIVRAAGAGTSGASTSTGGPAISVRGFGVKGDGSDDTAAINTAKAAGVPLSWPKGDYLVTSQLNGMSGQTWIGAPGARIYSNTLTNIVNLANASDVRLEGITFETTVSDTANDIYGVVVSPGGTLKRVAIRRCTFKCANRRTNGIKLIADGAAAGAIDDILIEGCTFDTVGRMGFEAQDHTGDTTIRMRHIRVVDSYFKSCGKLGEGIAVSFSGISMACKALRNRIVDSDTIGIEFAGAHQYPEVSGNVFDAMGSTCKLISFSNSANTNLAVAPLISHNVTAGRTGAGVFLQLIGDARLHDNVLSTVGTTMFIRQCRRMRAARELYDTGGTYALYLEGDVTVPSEKNMWTDSDFWTTNSTTSNSAVRFFGPSATENKVLRSRVAMGSSGVQFDQNGGAFGNELVECERNTTSWAPYRQTALTDADKTLTPLDVDGAVLDFTGTLTATRTVTFPRARRSWRVRNSTGQSLTLTGGSGTVSLAAGAISTYSLTDNVGTLT